jgi:polyphosphate kinase 2 (PPK2 family)
MEVESVRRWWDYTKTYQAMLEATDTPPAPCTWCRPTTSGAPD